MRKLLAIYFPNNTVEFHLGNFIYDKCIFPFVIYRVPFEWGLALAFFQFQGICFQISTNHVMYVYIRFKLSVHLLIYFAY